MQEVNKDSTPDSTIESIASRAYTLFATKDSSLDDITLIVLAQLASVSKLACDRVVELALSNGYIDGFSATTLLDELAEATVSELHHEFKYGIAKPERGRPGMAYKRNELIADALIHEFAKAFKKPMPRHPLDYSPPEKHKKEKEQGLEFWAVVSAILLIALSGALLMLLVPTTWEAGDDASRVANFTGVQLLHKFKL